MRTTFCNNCNETTRIITDHGSNNSTLYICSECDKELNNNFKFCILAAGKGTRNKSVKGLHKALLPLENKAAISHIIENLNESVEIVIATGYNDNQIISYMDAVHPDRKVTYIKVDNYDGPGSGPGYSLLQCKDELQCPFIFTSVDTILTDCEDPSVFTFLGNDWIGVADVDIDESLSYCLVSGGEYLKHLYFGKGNKAFIGIAGISDFNLFWNGLETKKKNKKNQYDDLHEYNVMHGFEDLNMVKLMNFTWYDTGNSISYARTKKVFNKDIVANKNDEAIFIDKNKVVKYFYSSSKSKTRVKRAEYLKGNVPEIKEIHDNMYSYDYIDGDLLSNVCDEKVLNKFLYFCNDNLFNVRFDKSESFKKDCVFMYETKTKERIKPLIGSDLDNIKTINGVDVDPINTLLDKVNWGGIYNMSIPSNFHGDLQPENIIYSKNEERFILIDWRETFGDNEQVGDIYYDLGKLYHALLINGQDVLKRYYNYRINGDSAIIQFHSKSNLMYFIGIFKEFCYNNNYNWDNIELLGILQYIGICSLYKHFHEGRYGDFLFLYGKYLLTKKLNNERIN